MKCELTYKKILKCSYLGIIKRAVMVEPDKPAIPGQWLFRAVSSHQQGIHTTCLAHHPALYAYSYVPCTLRSIM